MNIQYKSSGQKAALAAADYGGALLTYGAAVLFALAASTRWFGRGRDFYEYQSYFNAIPTRFSTRDTRFEPAFHLLAWSFKNIMGLPYTALAFFVVLASLLIKFHLLRRHLKMWWLAIIVYLCIFYPNHEYAQIRAAISLALVYLSLHFALDRRYWPAIIVGALGVVFHYSALIPLIAFVLARVISGKVALWSAAILTIVFSLFWKDMDRFVLDVVSTANPLVGAYALNVRNLEARPFSVNNLILFSTLVSAVMLGWLTRDVYNYVFTVMSIAAAAMLFIFINAPELAQRTKEVLFPSIIFCVCRPKLAVRTILPMGLLAADAGLLLYLAFRERLLG
jgi:hypothetical protein